MGVQGSKNQNKICARCFSDVPAGQASCPECGAPIAREGEEQSDQVVYSEIARANLHRMRHEFRQAEQECLGILRRYPNNVTANVMLGDISADLKDFERALEWYDLALDLKPGDPAIINKIREVRERMEQKEVVETAEKLGLPKTRKAQLRYVGMVLGLVLVTSGATYYMGSRGVGKKTVSKIGKTLGATPDSNQTGDDGDKLSPVSGPGREVAVAAGDLSLMKQLSGQTVEAGKALAIFEDPRTHYLTVIYDADGKEDVRALGARLGAAALATGSEALQVTLRGMQGGKLIYTADMLRSRLNETKSPTWKNQHTGPTEWINYCLVSEWPEGLRTKPKGEEKGSEAGEGTTGTTANTTTSAESATTGSGESKGTTERIEKPTATDLDPDSKEPRGSIEGTGN